MRNDDDFIANHPELFGPQPLDSSKTNMDYGFMVEDGWIPLIHETMVKISDIVKRDNLTDFRIISVKQKFGELGIYTIGANDEIRALIIEAHQKSKNICEKCGKPADIVDGGRWVQTLCDQHKQEFLKRRGK